jgi:phage baseplate assembly protein V
MQLLQLGVLAEEDVDDAEHFEQYGFKSVPFPGAEAIVVFPNGDRAHGIVIAVGDRRYRPTGWEPGEVGMFTDEGDYMRFLRGNKIAAVTAAGLLIGSETAAHPLVVGDTAKTAYDAHIHPTPMGPSGPPSVPLPPAALSDRHKIDS